MSHKSPEPAEVFVGCSGWHYKQWRGILYPPGLPERSWLAHYRSVFRTVEVNATFYGLPGEETVRSWRTAVDPGFVFAVKGSRIVTHSRRLAGVSDLVARFAERVSGLGEALGPALWQLPPSLKRDDALLSGFLRSLPGHLRHAVEFRHESWWHPDVYAALSANSVAICLIDMPGFTSPAVSTADFIYARLHGREDLYAGCYTDEALRDWAERLVQAAGGSRRIYAYFNNDARGYAVQNALSLRRLLQERS